MPWQQKCLTTPLVLHLSPAGLDVGWGVSLQLAQPDGEGYLQLQETGTSGCRGRHSWWALCGRYQARG